MAANIRNEISVVSKGNGSRGSRLWNRMLDYRQSAKLSLARANLVTASYKETEGLPISIRRAKAFEKILSGIPIFIEEDDLLAGGFSSRPMDFEWYPEFAVDQEMTSQNVKTCLAEGYHEADVREILSYFKDRSLSSSFLLRLTEKGRQRVLDSPEYL